MHPLFSHCGFCCKLLLGFAAGEPSVLAHGFLRQVVGQVAEGRLGLWAAWADPAGTDDLIPLQCAFPPGPVSSAGTFTVGAVS